MLPQLKMIYDIINASDDGFGLPIKGIVSKVKKNNTSRPNTFYFSWNRYWLPDF